MRIKEYIEREELKCSGNPNDVWIARYHRFLEDFLKPGESVLWDVVISLETYLKWSKDYPGWSHGKMSPSHPGWSSAYFKEEPPMNLLYKKWNLYSVNKRSV